MRSLPAQRGWVMCEQRCKLGSSVPSNPEHETGTSGISCVWLMVVISMASSETDVNQSQDWLMTGTLTEDGGFNYCDCWQVPCLKTGALSEDIVLITVEWWQVPYLKTLFLLLLTGNRCPAWRHCFHYCDWWQVPYLKTLFWLLWLMTSALPEDIVLITVDWWQVPYLKTLF